MSKTDDFVQLVNRLAQRTREGSLNWTRGIASNEYQVQSGPYRFAVSKELFGSGYRLQVFNGAGQSIEEIRSDQSPFTQEGVNASLLRPHLQELWTLVSGNADELKKIIKSL